MKVAMIYGKGIFVTGVARYSRVMREEVQKLGIEAPEVLLERKEIHVLGKPVGGFASIWAQRLFKKPDAHADLVHALDHSVAMRGTDVATVHDLIPEVYPQFAEASRVVRLERALAARMAKKCRRLTTVSESTRQAVIKHWGVKPEKVVTAYAGVDTSIFRPIDAVHVPFFAPDRPNIVYLGDNHPRKNLGLIVRALSQLNEEGLKARFIRLGPDSWPAERQKLEVLAKMGGVELIEPGFVQDDVLVAAFTKADAFAWASLAEGFGSGPIEAMACGAPVVSLETPVAREVYQDRALYAQNTTASMAAAIRSCLEQKRDPVGQRLHAKKYEWSKAALVFKQVYEDLLRA